MAEVKTGKISVNTENIFPIIKKSLYSDHDIFLRELVSNAVDATQKIKTLSSLGKFKGELGELKIDVSFDKEAKTITIKDNGIGMTADEVEKYINQIAFSGATDFIEKFKEDNENQIIGQFGLGFYSAFMVAEKVEISTLSYQDDSEAALWTCTGSTDYEIKQGEKENRGTEITLFIAEDSEEFLEEFRIREILDKYCKFLPVEVVFGTKKETVKEGEEDKELEVENVINNTKPLWTKAPVDITDEEYLEFYNELHPMQEKPLFWIHLNVDHPFNLTGILYFPKVKDKQFEPNQSKIQLYSNQVFITDSVKDIVPEFLQLLHGVIDSPDIPLNVSRSALQTDSNVRKISNYITRKVADKLSEQYKEDRKEFENKWAELDLFVKYGMLTQDKFYEKAEKFCLLKSQDGSYRTIEEYKDFIKTNQSDKDKNLIALYSTDLELQATYLDAVKKRNYDVLVFNSVIDSHFVGLLENKQEGMRLKRIDSESIDKLIPKEEQRESVLSEEQITKAKDLFTSLVDANTYSVNTEALSPDDAPAQIVQSEYMRRMKEQSATGGLSMGHLPDHFELILNTSHPYMKKVLSSRSDEKKTMLAQQALDLALLSQGLLKGEKLTEFINRSIELV